MRNTGRGNPTGTKHSSVAPTGARTGGEVTSRRGDRMAHRINRRTREQQDPAIRGSSWHDTASTAMASAHSRRANLLDLEELIVHPGILLVKSNSAYSALERPNNNTGIHSQIARFLVWAIAQSLRTLVRSEFVHGRKACDFLALWLFQHGFRVYCRCSLMLKLCVLDLSRSFLCFFEPGGSRVRRSKRPQRVPWSRAAEAYFRVVLRVSHLAICAGFIVASHTPLSLARLRPSPIAWLRTLRTRPRPYGQSLRNTRNRAATGPPIRFLLSP